MSNPAVRQLGTVKSVHGVTHVIGTDHDAVTIDGWQLGPEVRDDFVRLYFQADTEARARAEAHQGGGDGDALPGTMTDQYGDRIAFSALDGDVCIQFYNGPHDFIGMWLTPEKQEEFAQLYVAKCHEAKVLAEAGRRAEADGVSG